MKNPQTFSSEKGCFQVLNHDKNVNRSNEKKMSEMKLFPHFPDRQSFFDRLPHNFVLCQKKKKKKKKKLAIREATNMVAKTPKNEMLCLLIQ